MAIRHLYTAVCESVIEGNDGRISLIGIFHNLQARSEESVATTMAVVVALTGDDGDPYSVDVEGPDGFILHLGDDVVEVPSPLGEHRQWAVALVVRARPAVFPKPGVYRVVLRSKGEEVHSYPFGVLQMRVPPEEGEDDGSTNPD
jgi:hypothetical protein